MSSPGDRRRWFIPSPAALAPWLLLTAGVFWFHWKIVFLDGYAIPWDMRGFHLPLATAYADALSEGSWPLWDPYTACGRPLLANPQTAVFHPAMFAAVAFGREGLLWRIQFAAVLHVLLAGAFTFLLGRKAGLARGAAAFAAMMFALGAFPASQAEHWSSLCAMPLLPLAWLGLLLPRRWGVPVVALALAFGVLCGFASFALVIGISTLLLALALWIAGRAGPQPLAVALAGGGLAILLSAAQILPSLELAAQSVGKFRYEWSNGFGIPFEALKTLVWPNALGVLQPGGYTAPYELTHTYLYSGLLGVLIAAAGIIAVRGPVWRAILSTGAVSFVLMFGCYSPLTRALFQASPEAVKNVLYWYLFMAPFLLALSLLAGFGLQRWVSRDAGRFLLASALTVECVLVNSGRPMNLQRIADEPGVDGRSLDGSPAALAALRRLAGGLRIDTAGDALDLVASAPLTRIRSANGYDPLALERLIQLRLCFAQGRRWGAFYQVEDVDSPVLDLMSVRLISARGERPGWLRDDSLPGRSLLVNPAAQPRFRLATSVQLAGSMEEAARMVRRAEPGAAVVEAPPGRPGATGAEGSVRVLEETRQRVVLEVDTPQPGFLVTSEVHHPGWKARVDGRDVPVYYTNVAFRGLEAPAGRHRIELYFQSTALPAGLALSAAGALVLAGLLLRALRHG